MKEINIITQLLLFLLIFASLDGANPYRPIPKDWQGKHSDRLLNASKLKKVLSNTSWQFDSKGGCNVSFHADGSLTSTGGSRWQPKEGEYKWDVIDKQTAIVFRWDKVDQKFYRAILLFNDDLTEYIGYTFGQPQLIRRSVKIKTKNNMKIMPLNKFFISYRKTKLKKGDFVYSVKIPINKKNYFRAYKISKRFDDDISTVCASFNFLIKNKKIVEAKIAYGGMSEIPKRATSIEKKLNNSVFSEELFLDAQNLIKDDFSPIDDMRASKNYRIEIARNLLMKFFYEISTGSKIRIN